MKRKHVKSIASSLTALALVTALLIGGVAPASAASKYISKAKAVSIAAKDAKVNKDSKKFKLQDADFEKEGNTRVWDIEFTYDGAKYEYEINAKNKKIRERDVEFTKSKVKSLAVNKAGIALSDVKSWDIDHHDKGNYHSVYMRTASAKYSMKIYVPSGKITNYKETALPATTPVQSDTKAQPTDNSQSSELSYIGTDNAKAIAFAHASQVRVINGQPVYVKAALDNENGIMVYEIEFYADGFEFEYDINAETGSIVDWEIDVD